MRTAVLLLAGAALAANTPYRDDIARWRADRESALRAPEGWLSVAGLFWLHEGDNVAGADPRSDIVLPPGSSNPAAKRVGVFRLEKGTVTFNGRVLKPDDPGPPDMLHFGSVAVHVINRGGKLGIRMRDPEAKTRREFTGCKWFPIDEKWRVKARWTAFAKPTAIAITNILGMTDQEPSPGFAEFSINGHPLRLQPVTEEDHLFFMFKDPTSARDTYGAGRFLYADMPKDGVVELDFNKAENPPCAFTAFATCPLPPKQNFLSVAIDAGEKKYGAH